jgi:hypothetical protein
MDVNEVFLAFVSYDRDITQQLVKRCKNIDVVCFASHPPIENTLNFDKLLRSGIRDRMIY